MKGSWWAFCSLNKFEFGEQVVHQFILFECKYLFSILFFYFHKSTGKQDRYHTHAFNAISFKFFGTYTEYLLLHSRPNAIEFSRRERTEFFRYFPRDSFHAIGNGTGCLTMLISGPWKRTWQEYKNGVFSTLSWNRQMVVD